MTLASYDEAVAGWSAHLRSGGTTTWAAWLDAAHPERVGEPPRPLPDAVHLELVRLLNQSAGHPVAGLADRVLATASPGRGLVDVPLPFPAQPRDYGSPATDPARLPEEELIRLAVGVLAHLLPDVPRPRAHSPASGWPLPWRRRFQLHGSPGTVAAVRHGLLQRGPVESDWRPLHVVLARPLEVMMAEHWGARALEGGSVKWSTLWRRAVATGHPPLRVDVVALARRLEGRRREPVHVVVARDVQEAAEMTARVLGTRTFSVSNTGDLAQIDLMRRVNRLTALTAGPDRVRDLAARLSLALEGVTLAGHRPPSVPQPALAWARDQAARSAHDLSTAGYAVHGDPADLVPSDHPHSATIDHDRTLGLALAACLRTWRLQGGTP